jgi:membrane associated rhomboid family serine protease
VNGAPPPVREAFVLPLCFLTVAGAGGLRLSADGRAMSFVPPPLITLVLAVLLVGVMVRAGLLVPSALLGDHRRGLENASGVVIVLALFAASAQLFTCLTPDAGVLRLVFNLFFLFLLWNTLAAQPDRVRLLRSLLVVFGWAYVVRYVALASLADPQAGWTRRLITVLLEGASAGALEGEATAPLAGYVGFATVALYMIGLALLPQARRPPDAAALAVPRAADLLE